MAFFTVGKNCAGCINESHGYGTGDIAWNIYFLPLRIEKINKQHVLILVPKKTEIIIHSRVFSVYYRKWCRDATV